MNKNLKKTLIAALIITGGLAWIYAGIRMYEIRNHRNLPWRSYLSSHHHKLVGVADVAYISPWMTFDYITKIFKLPSTYLQQNLQINDSKYPLITLAQYAKTTNTNTSILIENIQNAVKKYLASSTPSTPQQ